MEALAGERRITYDARGLAEPFADVPQTPEIDGALAGVVIIKANAGSLTGAALRGGDLVVKGRVGARTGIDQKGGTIIVLGSAGSMTGFMMQRGRQILLGDVGPGLGDSLYHGTIYGLGTPPELQKFVCGKKLYNYDNLEPSERKLVL